MNHALYPVAILISCRLLGLCLPPTATIDHQPSYYLLGADLPGTFQHVQESLLQNQINIVDNAINTFTKFTESYKVYSVLDFNTTDLEIYFVDFFIFAKINGFSPTEYFSFRLFEKSQDEQDLFISNKYTKWVRYVANDNSSWKDKYKTLSIVPKQFVHRKYYYSPTADNIDILKNMYENNEKVFLKPLNDSYGRGTSVFNCLYQPYEELVNCCTKKGLMAEEYVDQCDELKGLNSGSLNTIRMHTYHKPDGTIDLLSASGRIGHDNIVDNFNAGGYGVKLDPNSGKVLTNAIDIHGNNYKYIGNTGNYWKAYTYPNWDKIKEASCAIAKAAYPSRHLGLDLAVLPSGDIECIEINGAPGCVIPQASDMCGMKPQYDSIFYPLADELSDRKYTYTSFAPKFKNLILK